MHRFSESTPQRSVYFTPKLLNFGRSKRTFASEDGTRKRETNACNASTPAGDVSYRRKRARHLPALDPTSLEDKRSQVGLPLFNSIETNKSGPTLEQPCSGNSRWRQCKRNSSQAVSSSADSLLNRYASSSSSSLGPALQDSFKITTIYDGIHDEASIPKHQFGSPQDDVSRPGKHWPVKAILWSKSDSSGNYYLVQWGRGVWKPTWVLESDLLSVDPDTNTSANVLLELFKHHWKSFDNWRVLLGGNLDQSFERAICKLEAIGEHSLCRQLSKFKSEKLALQLKLQLEFLVFNCLELASAACKAIHNPDKDARAELQFGSNKQLGVLDFRRLIEWQIQNLQKPL